MERCQTLHEKFQRLDPLAHAKVQIITYLLQKSSDGVLPYLGTSGKPCFLCYNFAQQFQLRTRDPDFKQQSVWKVPETSDIKSIKVNVLVQAIRAVAGSLMAQLLIPKRRGFQYKNTFQEVGPITTLEEAFGQKHCGLFGSVTISQAGTASILKKCVERDELPTDAQVIKDYGFDHCNQLEDEKMLSGLYRDVFELVINPLDLNEWRAGGALLESIKMLFYDRPKDRRGKHFAWLLQNENVLADLAKQKREAPMEYKDTYSLRSVCRLPDTSDSRQGSTAEALWELLEEEGLSGDIRVRKDYGFDCCVTTLEEITLRGLYVALKMLYVTPTELHEWRLQGTLTENIKNVFGPSRPPGYRGSYYPWFLRNQHILAASPSQEG